MAIRVKNFVEKCKKIKGFEIICALIIAAVALCVYFSVNAITDNRKTQATVKEKRDGLVGEIESILSSIDGVGECEVLVTYKQGSENSSVGELDSTDNIRGVVVVAQGGQDVLIRIKITNALCTLLKIEASNIQIFEMK